MSLVDITIAEITYKSYASLAEAAAVVPNLQWNASDEDTRKVALVQATQTLDLLRYIGSPTSEDQTTKWPRTGIEGVDPDEIPLELQTATALLAQRLVTMPALTYVVSTAVKSEKIGPKTVEYFSVASRNELAGRVGGRDILAWIRKWLITAPYDGNAVFGADGVSEFEDIDRFDRSWPVS